MCTFSLLGEYTDAVLVHSASGALLVEARGFFLSSYKIESSTLALRRLSSALEALEDSVSEKREI